MTRAALRLQGGAGRLGCLIQLEYDKPLRLPFNIEKSIHLKPSVEQRL